MLILTDTADSTVSYTTTVQVNAGVATYGFTDVLPGTYILSLDNSFEKIKLDDVLVTVSDSDTSKDISVIRNVFDITGTITSADDKADLSDITIILLDSVGNEVDRTAAEVTDAGAVYSFRDLAQGSYTVRIAGEKVKADDIPVTLNASDTANDIEVVRTVFDITCTITKSDPLADLSSITVVLLDSEGNELARTEAEVTGESASYSFSDLREGSYTVRIDSDKVEAEDIAVDITDTDVTANIAVSLAYLIGDVNNDGIVDVLDAADIQKFTAERITEFKKKA